MKIKKIHNKAKTPKYQSKGAAGFDLSACEDVTIAPGETVIVPTGLCFEIDKGFEVQIRPRSGLTLKTKLRVHLGTLDSDYRGEVGIICENTTDVNEEYPYLFINTGDRIAQGVLNKIEQTEFIEVEELEDTERGSDGFNSTGVK